VLKSWGFTYTYQCLINRRGIGWGNENSFCMRRIGVF
jgi:hypothetical protein